MTDRTSEIGNTARDDVARGPILEADAVDALDAATMAIAEVLDLETVLQLIVDRVRTLVEADYAALGIVGPDGAIARFITAGLTPEERERIGPLPRGHGLLGLIMREGQSFRIPDIGRHPASYGFPPGHPPMVTFLGVPIVRDGRPIGDLYLTDKRGGQPFDERDRRLVELFARHAAIAMENARLHDRLAALAIVEERERIGRDLHDGIIQRLYGVSLSLEDVGELLGEDPAEAAARVDRAIDSLQRTIGDIRHFIVGLRPDLLGATDLGAGLERLAEETRFATVIAVDVQVDVDVARAMDAEGATQLLGLAREALSNVARHSGAGRARICLSGSADSISLAVEDDGVGFDPADRVSPGHHGLMNMRERAALLGGDLHVGPGTDGGTRVEARIPRLREGTS